MTTTAESPQFKYLSKDGELRFTWEGGEYIDVFFAAADTPHATAQATADDWQAGTPWRGIPRTQEAFEAQCESWMKDADPTERYLAKYLAAQ